MKYAYHVDQRPPNYGPGAKSGPRRYFVNNGKIIHSIYETFVPVDVVESNISRNNHIT